MKARHDDAVAHLFVPISLLPHSSSSGLHGLNILTRKLNRYILYKSPQTQKPQVAASLNPECCT